MTTPKIALFSLLLFLMACEQTDSTSLESLDDILKDIPSIEGRTESINTPYVTAGDRMYMVGHQDGSFPDLGWHIEGEMGGIWDHPIKLMDGFTATLTVNGVATCLNNATAFKNYPFANKHFFDGVAGGIRVERTQYVPDGEEAIVIEYKIKNDSNEEEKINFMFNGMVDLMPVWLSERLDWKDGEDEIIFNEENECWVGKDALNDWYVVFGADQTPINHIKDTKSCDYDRKGKGANASLVYEFDIAADDFVNISFVIAGSYQNETTAFNTFSKVMDNRISLLEAKRQRYEQIQQTAQLNIPDSNFQQVYEWVKYNTDWLIREVPEHGRGLSAGIPDYPWWFGCDNTYSLQGLLATGRPELVFSTLELLAKLSEQENGNGRIIHEASTNGVVFNPGNINETPHFASMVLTMYQWTRNKDLLEKLYPLVKQGLEWTIAANDEDKNLLPDGAGMMEIHGLESEMIDVAVYTQQAFEDAAVLAEIMGDEGLASDYSSKANQLKKKINEDFWVEEFSSYADFIGTTEEAIHLIDDAIIRADTLGKPWAVNELKATKEKIKNYPPQQKRGFVLHHNWVVNTPMEMGIADPEKAKAALQTGQNFVNPFGMFVTGIDRDESAGTDDSSFAKGKKVFSYVGAVMTLPTGVQAIGENNYGNPDLALDYLKRMTRSFSFALPGSIYEVSPDFGMMTQAWNIYAMAHPVVTQFFGVNPDYQQQLIRIHPQMPSEWPYADLERVIVADNVLSVSYAKQKGDYSLKVVQEKEDWELNLGMSGKTIKQWKVGDGEWKTPASPIDQINLKGKEISLIFN